MNFVEPVPRGLRLTRTLRRGLLEAFAFTVTAGAVLTAHRWRHHLAARIRGNPDPQPVELGPADIAFDRDWSADASSLPANHIALRTLRDGLKEFHGVELKPASSRDPAGRAARRCHDRRESGGSGQAYRLTIAPDSLTITGNGDAGLFYGVQTLIQLARRNTNAKLVLPESTVEDWPRLPLRFLHWDTKHHQDRIETLKGTLIGRRA